VTEDDNESESVCVMSLVRDKEPVLVRSNENDFVELRSSDSVFVYSGVTLTLGVKDVDWLKVRVYVGSAVIDGVKLSVFESGELSDFETSCVILSEVLKVKLADSLTETEAVRESDPVYVHSCEKETLCVSVPEGEPDCVTSDDSDTLNVTDGDSEMFNVTEPD